MFKMLKKELIIILLVIGILIPINCSAVYIEIKPNSEPAKQLTISEVYDLCQDLKNADTTLGNNNLDPHLTLNSDWGAVAYLGLSVYGLSSSTSTTGNNTGVMNFGTETSFTSSIYDGASSNSNIERLVENKDTKYVEKFSNEYTIENTRGQALMELIPKWSLFLGVVNSTYPTILRTSLLETAVGNGVYSTKLTTSIVKESDYTVRRYSGGNYTFRPVIWNKVNK